jgi:hypothetical protein
MTIYLTKDEKEKIAVIKRLLTKKSMHQEFSFSAIIRYCVNYTYANIKGRR